MRQERTNNKARRRPSFPRGPLYGAGVLVAFVFTIIIIGQTYEIGTVRLPNAKPVESHHLYFTDQSDGAILVTNAVTGSKIDRLAPGTNGFIRASLRSLVRERRLAGVGSKPPFRLTVWTDDRVTLEDPSINRLIDLRAFGPTNQHAFARLIDKGSETQ